MGRKTNYEKIKTGGKYYEKKSRTINKRKTTAFKQLGKEIAYFSGGDTENQRKTWKDVFLSASKKGKRKERDLY